MKKHSYFLWSILFLLFCACNDSEEKAQSSSFDPFQQITATDGESSISAVIDNEQKSLFFSFTQEEDLNNVSLSFILNDGYTLVSPAQSPATLNLTSEQEIIVSYKGTPLTYTLAAETTATPPATPFKSVQIDYCSNLHPMTLSGYNLTVPLTLYTSTKPDLSNTAVLFEMNQGYTLENGKSIDTLYFDLSEKQRFLIKQGTHPARYSLEILLTQELPAYTEFTIQNGHNLGFWFGQGQGWMENGEPYFGSATEEKIDDLVKYGFDHFRIPLDEEVMWREDGTFREEGIQTLHNVLGWIRDRGAKAIVDLHWLRITNNLPHEAAEKDFRRCWKMLHEELKDYDNNFLAYELLNEAYGSDGYWNKFLANSIAMIRAWGEKERVIVCGCNIYQAVDGMGEMILPKDDPNLIAAFHLYDPMLLTHYGTSWTQYKGPIHYPGRLITDDEWENVLTDEQREQAKYFRTVKYTKASMQSSLQIAKYAADQLGVRIHCGEYACSSAIPYEDRLRWYQDMTDTMRELNIPFAHWPFGMGENVNNGKPTAAMIKALTGKEVVIE